MGELSRRPICGEQLGPDWVDADTNCQTKSCAPGVIGLNEVVCNQQVFEPPSLLEQLRQHAIVGSILGIRKGINSFFPVGMTALMNDETTANKLLTQGNYDRAFEVATGFVEYFDIHKQGKAIGSSASEQGAVMMGHATGFNQAMETIKGETLSGKKLEGIDRIMTGFDALIRISSTALTVAGGVRFTTANFGKGVNIVSPVFRIAGRDIVIVESSVGRQAFYRSSGANSGSPGKWFPVDEFMPANGWFNKAGYTQGPGLGKGNPLHRLGTKEFAKISKKLGETSIPKGQVIPSGKTEAAETTMNRILDFFGARKTSTTVVRPVSE